MKIILLLIIVVAIFTNCKKGKDKDDNNNNTGIVIKGKISGNIKGGESLANAKKVLVFSRSYFSITDIVNDTFSVSGQIGSGVALIFLDANNQYIGNLCPRGLNVLPLGNLSNGENTLIDLETLTLVGNSVIPSHDPFGNEILISQTEINSLKNIDGFYKSIAKNIDADNDGIADIISNKQIVIFTIFGVYGGHWGHNDTLPLLTDSSHYFVNYKIDFNGGAAISFSNGDIALTGPASDPYPLITLWGYQTDPSGASGHGFNAQFGVLASAPTDAPWGLAFLPFKTGTYTLTLDGNKIYTLDFSNVNVKYDLVIITPTLHTNSDGKLTSITLEYKLPDGTVINPASILTNVLISLSDNSAYQFYNSPAFLTTATGFSVINFDTPLDISSLHGIDIWYDDLLGNQYDIMWR